MKVVISGYGKMGHMVEDVLKNMGIECVGISEDIASFEPQLAKESVCIDFTFPEAFRSNYPVLARLFKAVVVGTTGWDDIRDEVKDCFVKAGTPMIYASNFSIGVNAVFAAAEKIAKMVKDFSYSASIEEIHHIHKLDAPSGTAKSLGKIVENNMGIKPVITSKREGEVPGIHVLTLENTVDKIVLSHEAFSRIGFAQGAVYAAMLTENITGVHQFSSLIMEKL